MQVTSIQQTLAEKLQPGPPVPPPLQSKAPRTQVVIVQQSANAKLQRPLATISHTSVVHRVECALQLWALYGHPSEERSSYQLYAPIVDVEGSLWRQLEGRCRRFEPEAVAEHMPQQHHGWARKHWRLGTSMPPQGRGAEEPYGPIPQRPSCQHTLAPSAKRLYSQHRYLMSSLLGQKGFSFHSQLPPPRVG